MIYWKSKAIFGCRTDKKRGKTETMQEIKKKKRAVALFVIVLICLCGWWAVRKEGFFLDEIYSTALQTAAMLRF